MNNTKLKIICKTVKESVSKHSPEILTGIGVAGMISSIGLAIKATPKAMHLIDMEIDRKNRKLVDDARKNNSEHVNQISKLKFKDVLKTTWKCYIPTGVTCVASMACLIGASSVHVKRNAVLATAYQLSESALSEYKDKVIETLGEKKEKAIADEIDKDRVKNNPVKSNEVIITGKGDTLCYDHMSGRYFKSDIDKLKKAVNELNRKMLSESYLSLNEFYDEIGLEDIGIGNDIGWCADKGLIELSFSSQIAEDGTPCLVLDHRIPPKYGYDKLI